MPGPLADPPPGAPVPAAPAALRIVAALVGAQGVALLAVPALYAVGFAVADTADVAGAAVTAVLAAAAAAALLAVARGLAGGASWARSPALVTELIAVALAYYLLRGGRPGTGLVLLVWATAVLVLLFWPSVDRVMRAGDRRG